MSFTPVISSRSFIDPLFLIPTSDAFSKNALAESLIIFLSKSENLNQLKPIAAPKYGIEKQGYSDFGIFICHPVLLNV